MTAHLHQHGIANQIIQTHLPPAKHSWRSGTSQEAGSPSHFPKELYLKKKKKFEKNFSNGGKIPQGKTREL